MDHVAEEHLIIPLPIISEEELLILQAQAAASVAIQDTLNTAMLNVQILTNERDAAVTREASVAHKATATVTRLEQAVTNARIETSQKVNFRIVAEGNAMNLNSLLLISEFSRVRLQDDNELLNQSAASLSNHRNQVMTENQTLLVSLEQAKSDLKLTQQKSSAENAALTMCQGYLQRDLTIFVETFQNV